MLSNPGLYVCFRYQAGLHFVGIGNYLITFPATSKYCGSASGVGWFFFALVSHQRSCPCREKIRVRFELAINWLCLSSCTYILCLSSCMYCVCQVVLYTLCLWYTSCACHVLHLLFVRLHVDLVFVTFYTLCLSNIEAAHFLNPEKHPSQKQANRNNFWFWVDGLRFVGAHCIVLVPILFIPFELTISVYCKY